MMAAQLGDDMIIDEILIRLPAKSVLRFRAVCKAWRDATADPAFLAAHARRRPLEALMYTVLTSPAVVIDQLLDALPVGDGARRRFSSFPRSYRSSYLYSVLMGSCDGLLLIGNEDGDGDEDDDHGGDWQYLVCNPATRQWADLPRLCGRNCSDPSHAGHFPGPKSYWQYGFYFHEPSGEYRLLCRVTTNAEKAFFVFSTGADEPRRLNLQDRDFLHFPNTTTPALLGGHLHWWPSRRHDGCIVAFDTVAETFRPMPPPPMTHDAKRHADLLVADGSLMASEVGHHTVDLWVLEGYGGSAAGDQGRWERQHRVELEVPFFHTVRPSIVAGGDEGDIILGAMQGLLVYNVRSRTVRRVAGAESDIDGSIRPSRWLYKESLVRQRHSCFQTRPHPGLPFLTFH